MIYILQIKLLFLLYSPKGISRGAVRGQRWLENEVESQNSAISQSIVFGKQASTNMMRGQNKDTDISHANASVFAQQEQQRGKTSVEKNLNTTNLTKAVIQRREKVDMMMQETAENKLEEILKVVTDIKKEMEDLQEHNKCKNDKKALLVEKLASDIDKNENYFESDSFVVSFNKGRPVCDLSELGLEYNDVGEFYICLIP